MKLKKLVVGKVKCGGRNSTGKVCTLGRGGGSKRLYRLVDFKRGLFGLEGKVLCEVYDPCRTANLVGVRYSNGLLSYILGIEGLKSKCVIKSYNNDGGVNLGDNMLLREIRKGLQVSNVELYKGRGGQILRSAGVCGTVIRQFMNSALLKLRSGKMYLSAEGCRGTIGRVSQLGHNSVRLLKCGRSRWNDRRSKVRGVAKNPVDHPHGGGEGRTSGGRCSVDSKGRLTKCGGNRLKRGGKVRKSKLNYNLI